MSAFPKSTKLFREVRNNVLRSSLIIARVCNNLSIYEDNQGATNRGLNIVSPLVEVGYYRLQALTKRKRIYVMLLRRESLIR